MGRILCFGEPLLRLTAPGRELLLQTGRLDVHVGGESYLERDSLTDAAARFAVYGFVRIHRSAVINPEHVGAIEKTRWGGLVVRLLSGAQIPVGRKFRAAIQAFTSEAAGGQARSSP